MSRQRTKVVRKGGGVMGKIVALLLGFILGIVGTIGGLVGGGYFLVSSVKIKDAVNGVSNVTGADIDYSQYITEEYAEKTVLGLIGSLSEVATEVSNGTGSLSTLEKISPLVRTTVENLTATTAEFGIPIDTETLMTTPFAQLADFATQTMNSAELGKVLQTVGFETSILKLLCYGEEGVHYTVENGEIVMLGSNKPLTIGDLTTDEGLNGVLSNISLGGLMASVGSVDVSDSLMRTLLYGTEGIDYEMVDGEIQMKPVYFLYNDGADYFLDDANNLYLKTADGYTNENGLVIKQNTVQATSTVNENGYDYFVYDKNGNVLYELKTPDGESDGYFAAFKNGVEQKHRGLTLGDLTGGKDLTSIFETLAIGELIVPDPSNSSSIQLALAYGEKDLHYTILPDNTVKMLPVQIAIWDGNAYGANGEMLDADVIFGSTNPPNVDSFEVKINGGKTYYLSASVYPQDGEGNQKTMTVGENQAPVYYAALDTNGTLDYYEARNVGSFLTGNVFDELLNSLTIGDIIGEDISPDAGLIYSIKDWKISSFMDSNAINSLKLSEIINVSEDSPAALKAIKDWTIGELQSEEKFNSLKIGDLVEVKEDSPEILKTIASWTIADMQSSEKFDSLKIGDLIEVEEDSPQILKTISDWTIADMKSSDKFDALKISNLIEIDKDDPNTSQVIKTISDWTIADLKNQSKFEDLYVKDLMAIDTASADTPAIMKVLAEWQLKELKDKTKFNTLKLNQLMEITESSPVILKELGTWTIADLQSQTKFDSLQIGKLITVTESSPAILKAISEWTLADMQNQTKFDDLYIRDLMTIDEATAPAILKAISGWQLKDMKDQTKFDGLHIYQLIAIDEATAPSILLAIQNWQLKDLRNQEKFDNLTLVQVLGEEAVNESEYFREIADTPISNLSSALDSLKITHLFAHDIYKTIVIEETTYFAYTDSEGNLQRLYEKEVDGTIHYYKDASCSIEGSRELEGAWRYMLQNPETGKVEEDMELSHMNKMIENMTANIQQATLNQLVEDDIVDLGDSDITNNDIKTEITVSFFTFYVGGEYQTGGEKHGKYYYFDAEKTNRKEKVGDLTINEMMEYLSNIFTVITEIENSLSHS